MRGDGLVLALLVAAAVPVNIYPLVYLTRPWWVSAAGRALMVKAWGNLLLIDLFLASAVWGDYPGREAVRLAGLSLYLVGVWWLLIVLLRVPRHMPLGGWDLRERPPWRRDDDATGRP